MYRLLSSLGENQGIASISRERIKLLGLFKLFCVQPFRQINTNNIVVFQPEKYLLLYLHFSLRQQAQYTVSPIKYVASLSSY